MKTNLPISPAEIARELGISVQAVSKWGGIVPPERVIAVAKAAKWRVRPHVLRPDLYPHPDDGMPAELRGTSRKRRATIAA